MGLFAWIILGADCRFHRQQDREPPRRELFLDIILGIFGAVVGGWVFNTLGGHPVSGVNLYSLLVAVIGSIIVLFLLAYARAARSLCKK